MKKLDLSSNENINDDGAAFLLDCLKNIKCLSLHDCEISPHMLFKIFKHGHNVGCKVSD